MKRNIDLVLESDSLTNEEISEEDTHESVSEDSGNATSGNQIQEILLFVQFLIKFIFHFLFIARDL